MNYTNELEMQVVKWIAKSIKYMFSITFFFCYLVKYFPGEGLLNPSVQYKGAVMYCLRSGLMEFWGSIFCTYFQHT